ncbi:hypothetical protein ACQ4WQ_17720 [Janthinobacterium sp. GB1R12]|uniref:hypothetical protein n=1 Tax=Janthinobacterium sp. GB1R12 TaxID=3424190 RepID=UPI003F1E8B7F
MASPTLKDYRETYYAASAKAGDIARQLAFAGIALVWIFQRTAKEANDAYSLPEELYWPTLFIVAALTLDLLQYCYKSGVWGFLQWRIERVYGPDVTKSYTVQEFLNWPTLILFWGKLSSIAIAYIFLLFFVVSHVKFSSSSLNVSVASKTPTQLPQAGKAERENSNLSLSNDVAISFSDSKVKPREEPRTTLEPNATMRNTVTITLPALSRTVVHPVTPEKRKDQCMPCVGQDGKASSEQGLLNK